MFNVKNYEYDCTRKCRLREHGHQITLALTKRSVEDAQLAAYIAKTCCNFCDIVDDLGRSAVHLAASVDRYCILEWLLNQGAIINGRDFESGSSPLHRALFYGCIDCAVLLLRYGASLELLDEDTRCALHNICRLRDYVDEVSPSNEILVWGSNKNYNLGIGNEEGTNAPQSVEFFRKEHVSLECVALGAYHSLFLDRNHRLYAVGHGKGGRLGIGSENSLATAKRVKVALKNDGEKIICISVSRKHSLLLTNHSAVFACGLNEDEQLGVRGAGEQLNAFKEVITLRDNKVRDLEGVIARDFHSMAYSKDNIYVWGSNHGQWGLDRNIKSIPFPSPLKIPKLTINFVEANNAATVVYTAENQILLFYNAKMRNLRPPNYEKLKSICINGGDCGKSTKGTASALKLLMLSDTNVIFFWYENTLRFYRCIFNEIRITQIDKIFYKANQVLILSQGDVYKGKCQQMEVPPFIIADDAKNKKRPLGATWSRCDQILTDISAVHMIRIDLQRIANVDRAVNIFCDDDFASFCVLQESQMKYFHRPMLMPEEYSFKKLYNEVSEGDAVHDLVFHVDGETFAAHKFIVYARATGLREIIAHQTDNHIYLNMEGLTGKMFELMLKYMYNNYYPDRDDFVDMEKSLGCDRPRDPHEIRGLFLGFSQKFGLKDVFKFMLGNPKPRFPRLHRQDLPELCDVRVLCSNEKELKAHKCILVARSEYFSMMFTHEWAEQQTINMSTVPVEYMEPILDFLYSSDVDYFRKQNYTESFLYNMIVFCDQFFIERLRKVCEILVLDKISIRKCGDMLDFAVTYNCEVMKEGCMNFICQNLARILCLKSLESCEPEALKCLNVHYRKMFKKVFDYRMITPDAEAVDDDLLMSFVDDFRVDLSHRMDDEEESLLKNAHKTKSKESNAKHSTRQYERDAISNMRESLSLDESTNDSKSKNLQETQKAAEKLHAEAQAWMKVVDKREIRRKQSLEHTAKAIEALKHIPEPQKEFVPLKKGIIEEPVKETKTPERELKPSEEPYTSTPKKVYNLNLGDFATTPKMSQKQRKRLSSGGAQPTPRTELAAQPIAVPEPQPNAWGIVPTSPQSPISALALSPPTGSTGDPTSFANMIRAKTAATPPSNGNSFSKILAEERQQRNYNERQRNKSLLLTQIEETAISELREFYNVDNVDDEHITIERKPMPQTQTFSSWRRN